MSYSCCSCCCCVVDVDIDVVDVVNVDVVVIVVKYFGTKQSKILYLAKYFVLQRKIVFSVVFTASKAKIVQKHRCFFRYFVYKRRSMHLKCHIFFHFLFLVFKAAKHGYLQCFDKAKCKKTRFFKLFTIFELMFLH